MNGRLFFRAESGADIGTGHVMRSLALASAWVRLGGRATWLTTDPGMLRSIAEGLKVDLCLLPGDRHPDSLDLKATLEAIGPRASGDWIAVDGYFFTPDYHRALRESGWPVLIIDDTAHLPVYQADAILNQNVDADRLDYSTVVGGTTRMFGPRYALLRPEFRRMTERRRVPEVARRVLVTLGGGDPDDVTSAVLGAVRRIEDPQFELVLTIGGANPHRDSLTTTAARLTASTNHSVEIHFATDRMSDLMNGADMAISAAGSTTWEMACMGVPAILVVTADNQRRIAAGLASRRVAINAGWHRDMSSEALADTVVKLATSRAIRQEFITKGQALVDGAGADRVARRLANLGRHN